MSASIINHPSFGKERESSSDGEKGGRGSTIGRGKKREIVGLLYWKGG